MTRTLLLAALSTTLGLLGFAAPAFAADCAPGQTFAAGDITVSAAFTRATLPNAKSGGGFMLIANAGAAPDKLIAATTEGAAKSEIHLMKMEGDMMKMGPVEGGLEIPAGGSVTLEPGGYHVMLMGLKAPLEADKCLALTLTFEKAGELPVNLFVGATDAKTAPMAHAAHN